MKRVKMNEKIGNNSQCLTSRSKKPEESHENDLFSFIPLDLKIEILEKLPAKSIAKLILLSKFWSSTIRGKDFTDLYLNRSAATRPRLLCIVNHRHKQFFHSYSQEDPFSDHHITRNPDYWYEISPPVRGLICSQLSPKVMVSNPSTGQFVTLPRAKTKRIGILSFLGYDPVNDVYKVLCMTVKNVRENGHKPGSSVVSEEHQVFTLGAQNAAWRMVECKHPHLPYIRPHRRTKGLCLNGVVYYHAWVNIEGSLISFDVKSEDFNVIKLPEDVRLLDYCNLVNYKGKIAVMSRSFNGTLDLRVLEDVSKQEWSKVYVLVPSWIDFLGCSFSFKGALSTGELIFATRYPIKPYYIICYDLKENNARKVVIEGFGDDFESVRVFLDHVESPMFLP